MWNDPEADVRLKKRVVRTLIEEILVDSDTGVGQLSLIIHWNGGVHTELTIRRRRRGQNSAHTPADVVEAVRTLTLICPDAKIAAALNRNGLRTGRGNRWSRERVTSLRSHWKIECYSGERRELEGWMTLTEAAAYTSLQPKTLRQAAERGELKGTHPLPDGPWVFKRSDLEEPDARAVIARVSTRRAAGQAPEQLTLF